MSSRLMTDAMQLALAADSSDRDVDSRESGTQTEGPCPSREIGTQTSSEDDELPNANIAAELKECRSDDDFLQLAQKPWPENLYQRTEAASGDLLDGDTDLALYVPGGDMYSEAVAKAVARFPELTDMGKDCQEDYIGSLLDATRVRDGDSVVKNERLIYKMVPAEKDDRGPVLEFIQMVRRLGTHMDQDDRVRVSLLCPPGISMEERRKVVEYAFLGTARKVVLHDHGMGRVRTGRWPVEANGTVIVKAGDKSVAEALKDVKEGLSDSEDVKLRVVKKTLKGDILLVVKGGAEGAKALEGKIRSKTGMAAHAREGDRKTLLIQGLDGVTSKEEVMAAVQEHLKCDKQLGFSVTSLRPTRRDNQTATLLATRDVADRLLAEGRIYVGWLECKIKERIELPKCFRCLEYGHTRAKCNGPSREDTCFKCGKQGHVAKECTESREFCHACQREGHRSSSTNCPIFRKMVSEARNRARYGRGNRVSKASR